MLVARLSSLQLPSFFLSCYGLGMTSTDPPILTVSQLSNAIKLCLEKTFSLVWLQGEISNFKPHTSGHFYFSLKDSNAQISAVMFRPDAAVLKVPLKNGMQIIARGEINVYPVSGKYQVVIRELRPVGLGERLLKLEELKIKLHKKGWFRSDRKRPLPKFPKRIGVVTSPTGAAIQDMLNILTRRFSGFHLILNPVRVQGEGAAQEIAQAVAQFNRYQLADVLIVGRGGGSIEDLWAFNEEVVAEAIFNSAIPIISAVGHETDHCIADYIADVRAPTPSAAAEIVIAEKSQQLMHLAQMQKRMHQTVRHLIKQDRHRLAGLTRHPVLQTPFGILGPWIQRLDNLREDIDDSLWQQLSRQRLHLSARGQLLVSLNPLTRLTHFKQKLNSLDRELQISAKRQMQTWRTALKYLKDSLDTVNPKNLLTKGYCILFSEKDHSAITSVHSLKKQEKVQIVLSDGDLRATIGEIIPKASYAGQTRDANITDHV